MKSSLTITNNSSFEINGDNLSKLTEFIVNEECDESSSEMDFRLNLMLVERDEIRQLNRKYRGVDARTDVLSFSDAVNESINTGDIIIDIEVARAQKGTMTLDQEIISLFIHGLLHVLGYDHQNREARSRMQAKEKYYKEEYIKE